MMPTDQILGAIEAVYPVTRADIAGCRRRRNEVEARQLFMWILRIHARMSTVQIGRISNRTTGSVCGGIKAAQDLYETCKPYRRMADQVLSLLNISTAP